MAQYLYNDKTINHVNIIGIIGRFLTDAVVELRAPKMHWPSREEVKRAFYAVVVLLVLGAAVTGGIDLVLTRFLDPIL